MKCSPSHRKFLPGPALLLAGALVLGGCQYNSHPDDKSAVYSTLTQHDLRSINVAQDRHTGVITLSGIVGSTDRKATAESLASEAAPGYTIRNDIRIENADLGGLVKKAQQTAQLDSAIQDHFKANLKSHKDLERRHIQFTAENGTLYLKGSVASEREKKEAEELAKKDPQVQKVVNDLEVGSHKQESGS